MTDKFEKATPRPWITRNIGEKENCYVIGVPDDEGYGDAICFVEEGSHATGHSLHDDARLIVAAVNERDALREALAETIRSFETINAVSSPNPERTMIPGASNDLSWCCDESRRALARIRKLLEDGND